MSWDGMAWLMALGLARFADWLVCVLVIQMGWPRSTFPLLSLSLPLLTLTSLHLLHASVPTSTHSTAATPEWNRDSRTRTGDHFYSSIRSSRHQPSHPILLYKVKWVSWDSIQLNSIQLETRTRLPPRHEHDHHISPSYRSIHFSFKTAEEKKNILSSEVKPSFYMKSTFFFSYFHFSWHDILWNFLKMALYLYPYFFCFFVSSPPPNLKTSNWNRRANLFCFL